MWSALAVFRGRNRSPGACVGVVNLGYGSRVASGSVAPYNKDPAIVEKGCCVTLAGYCHGGHCGPERAKDFGRVLRAAAGSYATRDKYTAILERGRRVEVALCRHSRGSGPRLVSG